MSHFATSSQILVQNFAAPLAHSRVPWPAKSHSAKLSPSNYPVDMVTYQKNRRPSTSTQQLEREMRGEEICQALATPALALERIPRQPSSTHRNSATLPSR
jgi:hypothetical protein